MKVNNNELQLDALRLKKAALIVGALNHPLRQKILRLIDENGRMGVNELYKELDLIQAFASQQLAILRRTGFVTPEREGKRVYYSINYERFEEVQRLLDDLLTGA